MPISDHTLRVVLHQLHLPENLGSVARVMANFGYGTLVLADPQTQDFEPALKLAVRAGPVLDRLQVFAQLDEALGPAVVALGTTSRVAIEGREVLTPEEGIHRLAVAAEQGPVALVLGGEKRGLSDAELHRCQLLVRIPTLEPQPSMNLSHAAAVLLYLCRAHARPLPPATQERWARLEAVHALERRMESVLLKAGYLNPQAPEHILGELVRSLTRGQLTQREVELWLGAFAQLGRG